MAAVHLNVFVGGDLGPTCMSVVFFGVMNFQFLAASEVREAGGYSIVKTSQGKLADTGGHK